MCRCLFYENSHVKYNIIRDVDQKNIKIDNLKCIVIKIGSHGNKEICHFSSVSRPNHLKFSTLIHQWHIYHRTKLEFHWFQNGAAISKSPLPW